MDEPQENLNEAETKERDEGLPGMATIVEEDPFIGTTLDGRYLVKRQLGRGGFGVVYLASDEKMMARLVVVKILLDEKISHEWSVRKFKQEMEAMARLDHPSIVGILDSGQLADGKPYIVMQYVDGMSLRSLITVEGMDFSRAANIVRQIGKALGTAHDRGILHRDLKPENIMLQLLADGDEQVKIIDFGVAKVKDSVVSLSTAGDRAVGTAAYMSPEQLSAGKVTPASDVYGFAVIAYEILTGRRPMNPDSAFQLLELQRSGLRIKPRDLRPNLSPAAEAIILKALSFEPKDRFQRARDFGDLLSAALLGDEEATEIQTRAARPDEPGEILSHGDDFGNAEPPTKFSVAVVRPIHKRRPLIAAVSLAVLGLAVTGAWYALRPKTTAVSQPTKPATIEAVGPEQSLTYWLTVQKMLNNKPLGPQIESTGNILFGNGWKFRLNFQPMQSGALYLLDVGPGKNGREEYNILFPVPQGKDPLPPDEKLDSRLAAAQTVLLPLTEWYRFVEQTGVERVWIIWSAQPIPELDAIFSDAARNKNDPGVIANPDQITQIQSYLKKYDTAPPEVLHDMSKKRTSVKGRGDIIVNLVELSHEPI